MKKHFYKFIAIILLILPIVYIQAAVIHLGLLKIAITDNKQFIDFKVPNSSFGRVVFISTGQRGFHGLYSSWKLPFILLANNILPPKGKKKPLKITTHLTDDILPQIYGDRIIFYTSRDHHLYNYSKGKLTKLNMHINNKNIAYLSTKINDLQLLSNGNIIYILNTGNKQKIFVITPEQKLQVRLNITKTKIPNSKQFLNHIFSMTALDNKIAFIANDANNKHAIYLLNNNHLKIIITQQNNIPEGLGKFADFKTIQLFKYQNNYYIAFIATGMLWEKGIYLYNIDTKKIIKVVDSATVVPASDNKFANFINISTDNGNILFTAIDQFNKKILGFYSLQYNLFKLITGGDQINNKQIKNIEINNHSLSGNNAGVLFTFNDHSKGIYVLTINVSNL